MRCFNQVFTVAVNSAVIARAKFFSVQVLPTVGTAGQGYKDTNQHSLKKIQRDHFVSKVGEEAVKATFQQLGKSVEGPDYQIYFGKQKSWEPDLWINGVGLAVKTQTTAAAQKFGLSWTFQASRSRRDPILSLPEAWVCFVEFDELAQQCRVYPAYQIKQLEFEAPKLNHLQGHKQVVYAERLPREQPTVAREQFTHDRPNAKTQR